ncbi:hypothetical protein [Corynebacterium caspium]|nr:hypothetical protein [Corynebacterium caspium]
MAATLLEGYQAGINTSKYAPPLAHGFNRWSMTVESARRRLSQRGI